MQEQTITPEQNSDADTAGEACSESSVAAAAVAEASSARRGSTPQHVLTFSAWFARQARLSDIFLLALELVGVQWPYLFKVMFRRGCLPVAGSPHAAIQASLFPRTLP